MHKRKKLNLTKKLELYEQACQADLEAKAGLKLSDYVAKSEQRRLNLQSWRNKRQILSGHEQGWPAHKQLACPTPATIGPIHSCSLPTSSDGDF
eukprot:SAG31_NODE_56_length_29726_cov_41.443312_2_plen_94_part_00